MREVTISCFLQYSLGEKCDAYALSGMGNCASTPETIGRNMPNNSVQYSDLGAPRFQSNVSPGTADCSLNLCASMESRPGFRSGHGLGSLGLDGQDVTSCAPHSMGLLHESGPGGFGEQGRGGSAGFSMPHRFEAMKARSFVEEAQSAVMAVPISNPGFASDVMAQSYQGLARKDCGSTDKVFMGMPAAPQPGAANGFFPGGPNGCAIPNPASGLTRMPKCSTDMMGNGFSAGFPSSNTSNRGALPQAPSCSQNIFESAFAYSQQGKQRVGDNLQIPNEGRMGTCAPPGQTSDFAREAASAAAFHGDATRDALRSGSTPATSWSSFGDSLSVDAMPSAKRLIRTDSHERLSTISSERANAENLFYCKGRRWGGESQGVSLFFLCAWISVMARRYIQWYDSGHYTCLQAQTSCSRYDSYPAAAPSRRQLGEPASADVGHVALRQLREPEQPHTASRRQGRPLRCQARLDPQRRRLARQGGGAAARVAGQPVTPGRGRAGGLPALDEQEAE